MDIFKTEQGKYAVQKPNTIKTELFNFPFILKLLFPQLSNPLQKCHHSSDLPGWNILLMILSISLSFIFLSFSKI